jgi:hypothetical protein
VTIDQSIPQEDGHHEIGLIVYLTVSIIDVASLNRTSQSYGGESAVTTCGRWSAPCTSAPPAALLTDFHDHACRLKVLRRQSPGRAPSLHTIADETVAALVDTLLLEVGHQRQVVIEVFERFPPPWIGNR